MELRQLNTFVTIANLKNFTKAAELLGYTQPTVTSQIQLLESELEVRLFERIRKNISLTHEGEKLLNYAKEILRLSEEAQNTIKHNSTPEGIVTIGALESLCSTRIQILLKEFHHKFPSIEVILKIIKVSEYEKLLLDNAIDVAFCLDQKITLPDFIIPVCIKEPLVMLTSPNHSLATLSKVHAKDLVKHLLILAEEDCSYRKAIMTIFNDNALKPSSIMEIGSIETMKQLAKNGMGVILLPRISVNEELLKGELVELNWDGPNFEFFTQVIYHEDKWISPTLQTFLEMIKNFF